MYPPEVVHPLTTKARHIGFEIAVAEEPAVGDVLVEAVDGAAGNAEVVLEGLRGGHLYRPRTNDVAQPPGILWRSNRSVRLPPR